MRRLARHSEVDTVRPQSDGREILGGAFCVSDLVSRLRLQAGSDHAVLWVDACHILEAARKLERHEARPATDIERVFELASSSFVVRVNDVIETARVGPVRQRKRRGQLTGEMSRKRSRGT